MTNGSKIFVKWLNAVVFLFLGLLPLTVGAQYNYIQNAFIVSPGKQEIRLSPGDSIIRNIYITNKFGHDAEFIINVEDVSGSNTGTEAVKTYGKNTGPYSIRNYVMVENDRINILAGETKVIPMMISLPAKIRPGGLYGGVFVSTVRKSGSSGANISSRIGSLIFLRINGATVEKGEVGKFDLSSGVKTLWTRAPVDFRVTFENRGNIYLNPYGLIEIKNWQGQVIDRLPIEPWFVFPDSLRTRLVSWTKLPLFGFFTANLVLNHGYSLPHVTTLNYKFLVIPLPLIASFLALVIIGIIIYKIVRKFKKWQV
jgi:hypothetical protein